MSGLAKVEGTQLVGPGTLDVSSELPAIFQLARALKQAQGFLPQHIKNEGEIVAVVLAGRELGIPPMAAIRGIKLVKGNVTLDAALQLALMARAGCKYEWLKDGSDGEAVLRVERSGQKPYDSRFTVAMAKTAGLDGDNWKKHTAAMLRARCVTGAGKAYMPDVMAGVYLPDELPDSEEKPVRNARTLDHVAQEGEQRARPTESAESRTSEPSATTQAPVTMTTPSGSMDGPSPADTGADGELLDAQAWRTRYEVLVEDLMANAHWIFEAEDEFQLPIPPVACPTFGPDGKRFANKRFDDPCVVGFLRKRAQEPSFDAAPADKRLWTLYAVARHESAKQAEAGAA